MVQMETLHMEALVVATGGANNLVSMASNIMRIWKTAIIDLITTSF
jgi:hypothetical protein